MAAEESNVTAEYATESLNFLADANAAINELGPFDPPRDFDHGEEFADEIPRQVPRILKTGSHASRQRGMIYSLIALGIMFLVFAPIPFIKNLGDYLLPLRWLNWIGWGLIAIGIWQYISRFVSSGRYIYVQQGVPFIGRVLDCQFLSVGTPDVPAWQHIARIQYRDPITDELVVADFAEPDHWQVTNQQKMSCTLTPGDYISLVYLPNQPKKPIIVYGFQGLDPHREYILKKGEPLQGTSPFTAVMIAFLIAFIVLLAVAAFDLVMFSFPVGGDWKLPVALGVGGLFVGGLFGLFVWNSNSSAKAEGKFGTVLGFGFLGAISGPLLMSILNAKLDVGEPTFKPVEVIEFWETTHSFVIRDYEIEYRDMETGKNKKDHFRLSQMMNLRGAQYGALEIGPGRFGYPHIKGIYPVNWFLEKESEGIAGPIFEITVTVPTEADEEPAVNTSRMKPLISINGERFAPAPQELIDLEVANLRLNPTIQSIELAEDQSAKKAKAE